MSLLSYVRTIGTKYVDIELTELRKSFGGETRYNSEINHFHFIRVVTVSLENLCQKLELIVWKGKVKYL